MSDLMASVGVEMRVKGSRVAKGSGQERSDGFDTSRISSPLQT